jgi:hypothetical protein
MPTRTRALVVAGLAAVALLAGACTSSPTAPSPEPVQESIPVNTSGGVVPVGG